MRLTDLIASPRWDRGQDLQHFHKTTTFEIASRDWHIDTETTALVSNPWLVALCLCLSIVCMMMMIGYTVYLWTHHQHLSLFLSSLVCIHLGFLRTDISGIDQASLFHLTYMSLSFTVISFTPTFMLFDL